MDRLVFVIENLRNIEIVEGVRFGSPLDLRKIALKLCVFYTLIIHSTIWIDSDFIEKNIVVRLISRHSSEAFENKNRKLENQRYYSGQKKYK